MSAPRRSYGELVLDGGRVVGWVREGKPGARPGVVLAHGAGAPYTSAFMEHTAAGLVERGLAVVRFHFPYMERRVREGGRRPPDRAPVLLAAWESVWARRTRWPSVGPWVLAGKSMGGRMASMLLAEGRAPEARGAIYFGYPLHPPGRPERLRDAHLDSVTVPQLFVQGTRDPLCRLDLLEPVLERIGPGARLLRVERGDHSLAVRRSAPLEGSELWLDACAEFVRSVSADR